MGRRQHRQVSLQSIADQGQQTQFFPQYPADIGRANIAAPLLPHIGSHHFTDYESEGDRAKQITAAEKKEILECHHLDKIYKDYVFDANQPPIGGRLLHFSWKNNNRRNFSFPEGQPLQLTLDTGSLFYEIPGKFAGSYAPDLPKPRAKSARQFNYSFKFLLKYYTLFYNCFPCQPSFS
jgi:hypothetical protein